jgi:hypothetical protein
VSDFDWNNILTYSEGDFGWNTNLNYRWVDLARITFQPTEDLMMGGLFQILWGNQGR